MPSYAAERFTPKVPVCARAKLSLRFDGRILAMYGGKLTYRYPAVSGKPSRAQFSYTKERQKLFAEGPIPEGTYWINPSELWENAWYRPGSRPAWGDFRITIHPWPNTETYGRGGFFIHGGSTPGSAGCIDLTLNMNKFTENLKKELSGLPACYIELVVNYL